MDVREAITRLEALDSREAAEELLSEYADELHPHPLRLSLASDRMAVAKRDIGWLLGELSESGRDGALRWLPGDIEHPILGRDFDRTPKEMLELGAKAMLNMKRGALPGFVKFVPRDPNPS